ncbi:MAG: hypothetical protein ACR2NN_25755, partial [Bryobacteraceae bacterium]
PTRTSGGSFIQDIAAFGIPLHLCHAGVTQRAFAANCGAGGRALPPAGRPGIWVACNRGWT